MSFSFCGTTSTTPFGAGRFGQTRGRMQGTMGQGVNYPSPFFDVAHTYLPTTIKQLFKYCRYYFLTNPLVNATVFKLAEYPVTDIIIDHENPTVKRRWMEYYHDHLRYRAFQVECGLDYFCLAGNTRVITEEGVRDIRDLAGKTVRVLSQGGVYREASFRSYGRQELWEVHTDDGILLATAEHEWPVLDKNTGREIRRTTRQLAGRSLYRQVATRPEQDKEFWTGVRHGIVFGDGTLSNDDRQAHVIFYSTGKKQVLARYFEGHGTITPHHEGKYLGVYGQPPHFKKMPEDTCSRSYWYGFVCGLLSTDGSVDVRGQAVLAQKDRSVLLAIAHRLPWLGILGGRVREHWAWNSFTKQQEPMNYLSLTTQYMDPQDFVRPDQREAFVEKYENTNYGKNMRVKKVVQTGRVEEVFCCVEPETHSFTIENGVLTGNCYGNGLNSVSFPFQKYLTCRTCKWTERADKTKRFWTFTNLEFRLQCPRCGQTDSAIAYDHYYRNASGIRLIRWNVEDVEVNYNDISGESTYFYTVPGPLRNDILIGKKDSVSTTPQIFIQSIKQRKGVIFSKDNLFHLKRPTLAAQDRGWGTPLILPVLKDTFYLQIMKKAQECVAPETLIETANGLRQAAEVQVGDLVRTHTGGYRAVSQRQVRPMLEERGDYAVKLAITGLRQLPSTFSDNHPMWVLRRNDVNRRSDSKEHRRSSYVLRNPSLYQFDWVAAGDVVVGDYVGYPTARSREEQVIDLASYTNMISTEQYVYSGVSLPTAAAFEAVESGARVQHDNPGRVAKRHVANGTMPNRVSRYLELDEDLAYVAGWYLGDGSCGARHVGFSMGPDDTGSELQAAVDRLFDVTCSHYSSKTSRGWQLCASNTFLAAFLSGWLPGDAKTKMIPKEILSAPDNVVLAFLRGYLEADGYTELAVRNDESIDVCCANKQLTYQLWSLLLSLGCISTVSEHSSYDTDITKLDGSVQHLEGGRPVFYWSVSSRSARRLGQLLRGEEADAVTSGKSGFFVYGYFAARILSAEVVPCEKVVSFEVEGAHTFCVPGMATHNSVLLEHIVPLRLLFPQAASGTSDPFCISPDTLVETSTGLLPACEVGTGDYLRSHTGAWRRVEAMKRRSIKGGEKVFKFRVASLAAFPFTTSEDHPILAVPRVGGRKCPRQGIVDPEFLPALQLKKGDYVAYPINRAVRVGQELDLADYVKERAVTDRWVYRRLNQEAAEIYEWMELSGDLKHAWGERKKILDEKSWSEKNYATAYSMRQEGSIDRVERFFQMSGSFAALVGWYLAEGSLNGTQVSFALHLNERAYAEEIELLVDQLGYRGVSHHERPEQNGRSVQIEDVLLSELLVGMCGSGFADKRMPEELAEAEDHAVMASLSSLFRGDGCDFETETNRVALKLANPSLILEVRRLLLSFGLIGGTIKEEPTETSKFRTTAYHLNYNGKAADHLRLLLRGGVIPVGDVSPQKSGLFRNGYVLLRIDDIKEVDDVPEVIGFQMHGDRSFCVAGVATHNTTINLVDWRDQVAAEIARWRYDCVAPTALVETRDGVVPAGFIEEGDLIRNHLGGYSRVEKAWRRPLREGEASYRLCVRGLGGVAPVVSEGHPFLAARALNKGNGHKLGEAAFIRAKDLQSGDYIGYPAHLEEEPFDYLDLGQYTDRACTDAWCYVDHTATGVPEAFELLSSGELEEARADMCRAHGWSENQFKAAQNAVREGRTLRRLPRRVKVTPDLLWVLGLYLAEGSVTSKQVLFAANKKESELYERVYRVLQEAFGASGFEADKGGEGCQHVFSSVVAAQVFSALCSGTATTKHIHERLMHLPMSLRPYLVGGMLAGDGCAHEDGVSNKRSYNSASASLACGLQRILLSLGVAASVSYLPPAAYEIQGRTGWSSGSYRVGVYGDSNRKLSHWLEGRATAAEPISRMGVFRDGYFWFRITDVEEEHTDEVIGFQVDQEGARVRLEGDTEAHGTFCLAGLACANSNYIPIMPLPLGQQSIGGDGRALLLFNEMQSLSEHIIMGMGVPREFLMGGLCLSQNSMVFTDRGLERLSEIRESGSARRKVVTHEGIGEASQLHQPGRKKVFRVRTRSGLTLDGASTHKLLTLQRDLTEDFTPIGSMSGGECVAVKVGANLWPADPPAVRVSLTKVGGRYANCALEEVTIPQEVTPELARIMGYLTSEGSCADPHRMSFSNTDKALFDDFVSCVHRVFNITLGSHPEEYDTVRSPSGKKTIYKTEISRQTVVEFLQGLGLSTDSYGKSVPECIRLSPKNIVVSFLRAYFDGDGGVSTSNGKLCVAAHSVSEELLQEVQLLLLNAGVVSSLYPPSHPKGTYILQIRSEFGKKYLAEIGFTSPTKIAAGELEIETRTAGNCSNTVPFVRDALLAARDRHVHGFGAWRHEPVDAVLNKEEYTVDEVAHLLQRERSSILIYVRKGSLPAELRSGEQGRFGYYAIKAEDLQHFMRTRGVGKRRTFAVRQYEYGYDTLAASDLSVLKTLEPELYSRVKLLQDQEFFWDEVVSVEELELEEEMLDLGVEGSHSYQANGIIGHNSYAGTNVSMRMLENAFLSYVGRHRLMARWVMKMVAHFMGWPEANVRFKPFKMADDLQRKAYIFQLNQAGKVSDQTLLADADLEQEEEDEIMIRETDKRLEATKKQQLSMAEVQGEQQVIMMKQQAKAQEAMAQAQQAPNAPGEPGGPMDGAMGAPPPQGAPPPEGAMAQAQSPLNAGQDLQAQGQQQGGVDIQQMAQSYAEQIMQLPPDQQQMAIDAIAAQSPELAQLVQQILSQMGGGQPVSAGVDQRPLPDKLPARRDAQLV